MRLDYTLLESVTICNNGVYDDILSKGYSSSITKIIGDKNYIDKYFDSYFYIEYYNQENFLVYINNLLDLGYTSDEINIINKRNDLVLKKYLEHTYVKNINKWLEYPYFKSELIDRYLSYFSGDYERAIIDVNIGLDKNFYVEWFYWQLSIL